MGIKASLLLATYEMPTHLEKVMAALDRQSTKNFEILLCDDGSGSTTAEVVNRFRDQSALPFQHFWQEHLGFRKCKILNEAIRAARGEVLIFLDGDCVPHRKFIEDHVIHQEQGRYLAGRRMDLGQKMSEIITVEKIKAGYFNYPRRELIMSALAGELSHVNRSLRISWPLLRKSLKMDRIDDLKGCNFSVARKDLLAINGFDEAYEGYGREDTDVELRMQNFGLKIKSLKGLALQYHFWHPRREFTPVNEELLTSVRSTGRYWCEKGIQRPTP